MGVTNPNIVYIMTDQQRYDTLSSAGRSDCQTPNLDRLAAEGARFDNAYTVCALCSPSRTSMLTGRYPHNHRAFSNYPHVSDDAWRDAIAKYWGFCSFIDAEIGRLLDALQDMGREDDTAVLFSTDHGDMTGSHGGIWDKSAFMYEETYRIPLIARVPGMAAGIVCQAFVSNMDLATTVLDIAGLPIPANHDGRSLLPLFRNPKGEWRDDLMSEFHGHRFLYSQRMVRLGDYKYIFNAPDEDELYDLASDPHELVNLIDDAAHSGIAEEGRQRLLQWIQDTDDPIEFAAGHMLSQHGQAI